MNARPAKNFAVLVLIVFSLAAYGNAQGPPPRYFNERFVIKAMDYLHQAQATYNATTGVGNFGTLEQLRSAGLLDEAFASGSKFGYAFVVTPTGSTYTATGTPVRYKKTGLRSYYIDQTGLLRGADNNGEVATASDPYIDSCALFGLADNERCTILDMRAFYTAQTTYAATIGNGNYGTFSQLYNSGLIREDLADLIARGYFYGFQIIYRVPKIVPASFKIWARPQQYGTTGTRSFFIDQTGVLRGADHQGQTATENDPPINQ